jgi:hypothetical protein
VANQVAQERVQDSTKGVFVYPSSSLQTLLEKDDSEEDKSGLVKLRRERTSLQDLIQCRHPDPTQRPEYPNFTTIEYYSAGNGNVRVASCTCIL